MLPVSHVNAVDLSLAAEGVEAAVGNRRRAARSAFVVLRHQPAVVRNPPILLAGPGIDAVNDILILSVAHRIELAIDDGHEGATRSELVRPDSLNPFGIESPGHRGDAVVVGPEEVRPVASDACPSRWRPELPRLLPLGSHANRDRRRHSDRCWQMRAPICTCSSCPSPPLDPSLLREHSFVTLESIPIC